MICGLVHNIDLTLFYLILVIERTISICIKIIGTCVYIVDATGKIISIISIIRYIITIVEESLLGK